MDVPTIDIVGKLSIDGHGRQRRPQETNRHTKSQVMCCNYRIISHLAHSRNDGRYEGDRHCSLIERLLTDRRQ